LLARCALSWKIQTNDSGHDSGEDAFASLLLWGLASAEWVCTPPRNINSNDNSEWDSNSNNISINVILDGCNLPMGLKSKDEKLELRSKQLDWLQTISVS